MHGNDLGRVVNAVDDPVVAAPRREKAGEFADERFAAPIWVFLCWAM
jgi:hypothetical protein